MKILVISDIHGNCLALDEVLKDCATDRVEAIVCLGDSIQGGPQPAETVARLRSLDCHLVMGNADHWMLTGEGAGHEDISEDRLHRMEQARLWSLAQLSNDDVGFIKEFVPNVRMPLDGGQVLLAFHGSPTCFDDVVLPSTDETEARALLAPSDGVFLVGGHVHVQFIRHFGATFHFNPGSVGHAYRHGQRDDSFKVDSFAEYAMLTTTGKQSRVEFRRVAYDVKRLAATYRASGRPFAEESIAALDM